MAGVVGRRPGSFEPWKLRGGGQLDRRRRELFALASPVFRREGYRGATIKALAHACGVSPATLYHYFASKEDFATYLVRQPRMDWNSTWVDPDIDALDQLRLLVDLSITELPNYLLALQLADEVRGAGDDDSRTTAFREGESVLARLVAAAAPGMTRTTAARVARDALVAMVGTAMLALDPEPAQSIRERVTAVLRAALVPTHIDAGRFDVTMRAPTQAE